MKKTFIFLTLALFLVLSAGYISASCGYHDYSSCKTDETIVEGKIYFADTTPQDPAVNADVTVTCYHNNQEYTKETTTLSAPKIVKGTYFVLFPQSHCVAGDDVFVSAVSKDGKSGSAWGKVKDFITRKALDIDLAIINVPLVPEFGLIAGMATALSGLAVFFVLRRK